MDSSVSLPSGDAADGSASRPSRHSRREDAAIPGEHAGADAASVCAAQGGILISGAGPVGCSLALLLAAESAAPSRICLSGVFPAAGAAGGETRLDPRALALNHGSRVLLEQLRAWPDKAADILTVHVSQRGRLGRTLIRHEELGVPRLGSVVTYDALSRTLHEAVRRSGIQLHSASQDAPPPEAQLRVQSDGARPKGLQRTYGQHALLCTVQAGRALPHWAFERFTAQGPLALLPHPAHDGCYSLVWCTTPERAASLAAMTAADFDGALQSMFGERLGQLRSLDGRTVFPLSLHAGPVLPAPGTVAIGNAAQTLHPVAGQGLNLGLRDAAQLAQALAPWLRNPALSPEPALRQYARMRRADRWLTMGITDTLPRFFATRNPLVQHMGGLGLLTLDLLRIARAPLASQLLMGLRA
ncbi:FAD-dependent monooxygenase [Paracandidimonas soli]|uniref:FAD-dependent monooxygenase n=1 Tax=Paracandidimonas soli TaxID=1917182 RepID=UPI00333E457B